MSKASCYALLPAPSLTKLDLMVSPYQIRISESKLSVMENV